MKYQHILSLSLLMATAQISAQTALLSSRFSSDLENWTSSAPQNISWASSGGNPDGFLKFDDKTSTDPWIFAPTNFIDLLKIQPEGSWFSFDYTRINT